MLLRPQRHGLRRLSGRDRWEVLGLLRRAPEQNAFLLGQIAHGALHRPSVAGVFGGYWQAGELRGVACVGSNLVLSWPCPSEAIDAFVGFARPRAADVRVIVGEDRIVDAFIRRCGGALPVLIERAAQRLLRVDHLQLVDAAASGHETPITAGMWAGGLRPADVTELELLVEADLAMVREELGVDPFSSDMACYRRGWLRRIRAQRCWVIGPPGGPIAFKVDLSATSEDAVQLSGIYTAPNLRRLGVARRAVAEMCAQLLAEVPVVTLYVHGDNHAALHLYRGLGFELCGRVRSIWLDAAPDRASAARDRA